jgi:dihydrofolate reductase
MRPVPCAGQTLSRGGEHEASSLLGGDEPRWIHRGPEWRERLDPGGPDIDFASLTSSFDTILMGRRTYEAARRLGGGPGMPGMRSYVLSRTLRQADCPDVTVSGDARQTVESVKAVRGKDIWLFGGGSLFRSLLGMGLVDSVEVAVVPVLLGGGIRLLPDPAERARLRLTGHRVYDKTGTVTLEYALA